MGQLKLILSFIFIALFAISIIGYAVNFAIDNEVDANMRLQYDPEMNSLSGDINSNLDSYKGNSQETYQSLTESAVTTGETLESGAPISLTVTNLIGVSYNIINVGFEKIFGRGGDFAIYGTIFVATLLMMFAMYFLKTWLGRNPD